MPMLGDVLLDTVYSEDPDRSVNVTEHPIESKENIVDHIEKKAITIPISGVVTGKDASKRMLKLQKYMETGKLLKYSYRNAFSNVVIESFKSTHDVDVKGGFKFSITLKQVRISKPSVVASLPKPVKKQVAKVTNKGRQQTKSKTPKKQPVQKTRKTVPKINGPRQLTG